MAKEESREQAWVLVLETSNQALLLVAKSVLDAAGVDYAVQGEEASSLLPLGPFGQGTSNQHGFNARVHVPEDQGADAKEILAILSRESTAGEQD